MEWGEEREGMMREEENKKNAQRVAVKIVSTRLTNSPCLRLLRVFSMDSSLSNLCDSVCA